MLLLCSFGHYSEAFIPLAHLVLLGAAYEKKAFSNKIRLLLSGEQFWSGIQARETSCTQPGHRENWAAPCLIHPSSGSGLGGTKATVASWSKPTTGLVCVH